MQLLQRQGTITQRPRHEDGIPWLGPTSAQRALSRHKALYRHCDTKRPTGHVPTDQIHPVRPHSEASQPVIGRTTIKGLLDNLFSPYPAVSEGRLTVTGEDATVDDRGATPIALLFHELATNAVKYGALSAETGSVDIAIRHDGDEIILRWTETGGPEIEGEPGRTGFGTRLAEMSVGRQLGGRLTRDWKREGLVVEVAVAAARLARDLDAPA